ncbi:MAG: hypothetical protein ACRDZ6_03755 [Acidimicrobiales bacterium]
MKKSTRAGIIGVLFVVAVVLIVFGAMEWLATEPETVNFTAEHTPGTPLNLTFETVGSIGFGIHPQWVSYLVKNPQGQWIHSTYWQLPAHTLIHVTAEQFDSGSPLRNQRFGHVTGVLGGKVFVQGHGISKNGENTNVLDGNTLPAGIGHTFMVPALDIAVPLPGVDNPNVCAVAPCLLSQPHNIIKFSFMTPGPGNYRFQCFIPCGLSYLYGNGGPMSTMGYMGGFLEVQ